MPSIHLQQQHLFGRANSALSSANIVHIHILRPYHIMTATQTNPLADWQSLHPSEPLTCARQWTHHRSDDEQKSVSIHSPDKTQHANKTTREIERRKTASRRFRPVKGTRKAGNSAESRDLDV